MPTDDSSLVWIEAEELARQIVLMPEARRRLSRTEKVWSYRSYQGGEHAASIDWLQSARGDKILVREKEDIRTKPVLLWTNSQRGLFLAATLGFMLLRGERTVGWAGGGRQGVTQTAALWRLASPPENGPPKELGLAKAPLVFFLDKAEEWPDRLKNYARQGFEGLIIACGGCETALLKKEMQTTGWPVFEDKPHDPPEKLLLALFEETLTLSS